MAKIKAPVSTERRVPASTERKVLANPVERKVRASTEIKAQLQVPASTGIKVLANLSVAATKARVSTVLQKIGQNGNENVQEVPVDLEKVCMGMVVPSPVPRNERRSVRGVLVDLGIAADQLALAVGRVEQILASRLRPALGPL